MDSGQCWFCKNGTTNRCTQGIAFGTQGLNGGQSEYVRVPFADTTLRKVPSGVPDDLLIMMCDIFPTGFYGASRALQHFEIANRGRFQTNGFSEATGTNGNGLSSSAPLSEAVFVCLGCGPVGLCAILTLITKGVGTVYAVDAVDDRLEEARKMGASPLKLGQDDITQIVKDATDSRGADAVVEVVGNKAALRSAFDLVRPCGYLSSIGFHQSDLPFTGLEAYQKNIK
jgi:threonine dehydrogenase-like Zn-dependent dehydrogenase